MPTSQLQPNTICIIATHQSRMMCLFRKYSDNQQFSIHRFMNCAICSLSNDKSLNLEYNGQLNDIEKDYFSFKKTYWCTSDSADNLNTSFDNIVFGSMSAYLAYNLDDIIKKLKEITITSNNKKTIEDILKRLLPAEFLSPNKSLFIEEITEDTHIIRININVFKKLQQTKKPSLIAYNALVENKIKQSYRSRLSKLSPILIKSIQQFIESFLEDYLEDYLNSKVNLDPYKKFIVFVEEHFESNVNLTNIDTMFFIRHGEGIHNKATTIQKAFTMSNYLDANLTDIGKQQAEKAGKELNEILSSVSHGLVLGFASDLQRTQNTLDNINKQLTDDNKITQKYILPCSHEIGVKKGQCDDAAYANSENKSTIDLDKLKQDHWNIDYYEKFYGENRRNNRSYDLYNKSRKMMNKRRYCKDTDMIKEVISIVDLHTQNNSVLSQGGKKTRKNYKKKSRKIKKKCKIKKSKTCRRNNK